MTRFASINPFVITTAGYVGLVEKCPDFHGQVLHAESVRSSLKKHQD